MAIFITGKSIPQVWEKSIVEIWNNGCEVKTQYDKENVDFSKDATMMMEITEPMSEPRIHRAFPGGIVELEVYRQEVVEGLHNNWVNPHNKENEGWRYGYYERLANYSAIVHEPHAEGTEWVEYTEKSINQIQYIIDTLKACPHSRRAQAVIWKPWFDTQIGDCPCLQHVQCRIIDGKLNMNVMMRSNDAFRAAFMNIFAFTDLQRYITEALNVEIGTYTHVANSYHIYHDCFEDVKGFLKQLETRTFEERTYRTDDPTIQEIIKEAKEQIIKSIQVEKETGRKGL
jgi:thymidylate synthase